MGFVDMAIQPRRPFLSDFPRGVLFSLIQDPKTIGGWPIRTVVVVGVEKSFGRPGKGGAITP